MGFFFSTKCNEINFPPFDSMLLLLFHFFLWLDSKLYSYLALWTTVSIFFLIWLIWILFYFLWPSVSVCVCLFVFFDFWCLILNQISHFQYFVVDVFKQQKIDTVFFLIKCVHGHYRHHHHYYHDCQNTCWIIIDFSI